MELWAIWVIIGLVALLIEIFTVSFAVSCFSIGAFVAAVAAWLGATTMWQLSLFSIVTILALIVVRPVMIRLFMKGRGRSTNVDALVGRRGVVTTEFRDGEGRVSIDGDDWRARIDSLESTLEVGARVEVVSVDSVVLTVKR